MYTVHCTVYSVQCTFNINNIIIHTVYNVQCTLYTVQCTFNIDNIIIHTVYTVQSTFNIDNIIIHTQYHWILSRELIIFLFKINYNK